MHAHATIGLDLGITTKHRAHIVTRGAPDRSMSVSPRPTELDALLEAAGGPDHVDVVLEPTGLSWVPVAVYAARKGACVYRVDTRQAHGIRKLISRDVKSDQADASALARTPHIVPELRPLAPFDGKAFVLARLARMRESLIDNRTQVVLRVKSLLQAYAPTLASRLIRRGMDRLVRTLLKDFLDPQSTLDVGPAGLHAAVRKAGFDDRAPKASTLIHAWVEAAEETQKLYDDCMPFDIAQRQMRLHLDHFDTFAEPIEELESDMRTLYRQIDPLGIFETLPGVGPIVGTTLCAVLGGPETLVARFPSADHLVSFVGFDPRKNQTGGSDRAGQRISKSGSRLARRHLYLAAETARRRDPQLAAFFGRLRERGKHHNCAVVAVAAKLLRRLYAVCKRAVAGGGRGYELRDVDGTVLDSRQASAIVSERHPSQAAQERARRDAKAKKRAERATAGNTRQPEGSSNGLTDTRPSGRVSEE